MRVIIAGTRTMECPLLVNAAVVNSGFDITEVVCGGCRGVDSAAEVWAENHGVRCVVYEADWKKHGRAAGPIRNAEMAENADALIAIWDGKSAGTKSMVREAEKRGLKLYIERYREPEEVHP